MASKATLVKVGKTIIFLWTIISFANEVTPFSSELICKYSFNLNAAQRNVCMQYPSVMAYLSNIIPMFYEECTEQFKNERWNCSNTIPPIFGDLSLDLRRLTKETAFVYAMTNAAVVHAVAKACSDGELKECGCDNQLQGQLTEQGWQWGACSDNVEFGNMFAKQFLDARETENIENKTDNQLGQALVNLHNNGVGRSIVYDNMETQCKCHGLSGACSTKTCWRRLPSLHSVSSNVKAKYDHAVKVSLQVSKEASASLRQVGVDNRPPAPSNALVFMKKSTNFCVSQKNYTLNRECKPREQLENDSSNNSTDTLSACEDLCCNGDYIEETQVVYRSCECQFVWCCDVICKTCLYTEYKYKCAS